MIPVFASLLTLASMSSAAPIVAVMAPEHARPKLIAEQTGVAPGGTVWVGVRFEIDKEWHLYWDGQNDSGVPVKGEWTHPSDVKMGNLIWPAPERGVYPLEVIDYIYEKEVTAIMPVTVSKDAKVGSKVTLSGKLTWLVCAEQCIPGKGDVTIEIPVIAEADVKPSADAKHFTEVRNRLPKASKVQLKGGTNVEREGATDSPLVGNWERNTLVLSMSGAKGMVFYPDSSCSKLTNAIKQGESNSGELRFALEAKDGVPLRASGIVEVKYAAPRKAEFHSIAVLKAGLTGQP